MKKLILILAVSVNLLMATKTFFPYPVVSSNGRPLPVKITIAYPTGTTANGITLTHHSAGFYYTTATVAYTAYDLNYNSLTYLTNVNWGSGITATGDEILAADTTALKAITGAVEGSTAYLKQRSSTDSLGGGLFVLHSAAWCFSVLGDSTTGGDGIVVFTSATAATRWVRYDFIRDRVMMTQWAGIGTNAIQLAAQDSANAVKNNIQFEVILDAAFAYGKVPVVMPSGTILLYPDARLLGGEYGIRLKPDVGLYGQGKYNSIIQLFDPTGGVLDTSNTVTITTDTTRFSEVAFDQRNVILKDFGIKGNTTFLDKLTAVGSGRGTSAGHYETGIWLSGFTVSGTLYFMHNVTIDNIYVTRIAREAIVAKHTYQTNITNNTITECGFTTISIGPGMSGYVAGNYSNRTTQGMEFNQDTPSSTNDVQTVGFGDSTGSLIVTGNESRNHWFSGIWIDSGNNINLSDNIMTAMDTTANRTASNAPGIWIKTAAATAGGYDRVLIAYNTIIGFETYGVRIGSGNIGATDTVLHSLKISNNIIENSDLSAMRIEAGDSSRMDNLEISNNMLVDNQRAIAGDPTLGAIAVWNADSSYIHDNKVWNDRTATTLSRVPVSLKNSTNALIENNDFRSPRGENLVYTTLVSQTNGEAATLINNRGLQDRAIIYNVPTPTYGYQNFSAEPGGMWKAVSDDSVAFYETIISGNLSRIKYNASGTVVDTLTLLIGTSRTNIYFSGKSDTLALTGSGTWDWMTNSDSTLFSTAVNETDITRAKDSLTILTAGLYDVHGNLTFKSQTSANPRLEFIIGINGTGSSAGGTMITAPDSAQLGQVSYDRLHNLSVGDYIKFWVKNYTNTDNITLIQASIVFRKVD